MAYGFTAVEMGYDTEDLGGARFVPLIGEQGWKLAGDSDDSDPASR